jgi:hypothetical protein
MRPWPSWLAVFLGAAAFVLGLILDFAVSFTSASSGRWYALVGPFLLGGSVLLAAGLHSLQASYDAWCDCADCAGAGCGCNHCEDCVDGDCCGECSCAAAE